MGACAIGVVMCLIIMVVSQLWPFLVGLFNPHNWVAFWKSLWVEEEPRPTTWVDWLLFLVVSAAGGGIFFYLKTEGLI